MKARVTCFCLLLVGLTTEVYALPSKCLQAPKRINACPHLIYKKSTSTVVSLGVEKGGVICICLTDVKALNNTATTKVEKIEQQFSLKRIAEKYQLSEQDIFTLIKD